MNPTDQRESEIASAAGQFKELVRILDRLRDPGGCPWDREQTFSSLRQYLVEESAEALEALDANDLPGLKEELGDVLLQIVFLSRLAAEENAFSIADVIAIINAKMIHRHPHVFGDTTATSAAEVAVNWEILKAGEKQSKPSTSVLGEIPATLPALQRAQKVVRKATQKGFDQRKAEQKWQDVDAGIRRLRTAVSNSAGTSNPGLQEEFGALLFSMAGLAHSLEIDSETALSSATATIHRRLQELTSAIRDSGRSLDTMTAIKKSTLWQQATSLEKT